MNKFDFIIMDNDFRKIVFRFHPKQSSVHGFDDTHPNKWEDVYKVYFSYSIFCSYKENYPADTLFEQNFDECSAVYQVSYILGEIINNESIKSKTITPFGDGTFWEIKYSHKDYFTKEKVWSVLMWMNNGRAYRFVITKTEAIKFKDCIDRFLDYMIRHSVGI